MNQVVLREYHPRAGYQHPREYLADAWEKVESQDVSVDSVLLSPGNYEFLRPMMDPEGYLWGAKVTAFPYISEDSMLLVGERMPGVPEVSMVLRIPPSLPLSQM